MIHKSLTAKYLSLITFFSLGLVMIPHKANSLVIWAKTFNCQEYQITIQQESQGNYKYLARSRYGNLDLTGGTLTNTEGVRVFKFRNANTQYWVWDGTLDSEVGGVLEVYQNNKLIMTRNCS